MALADLREFLEAIESAGELVRVAQPVRARLEVAEVADRCMKSPGGGPALVFEHVLLEDGRAFLQSEGTIRMFERLGFPWSLMALFRIVPRALRDKLYHVVARNRLDWFGRREICFVPEPGDAERFIE